MIEEWKLILEFDNYKISSFGRVKNIKTNKILTNRMHYKGYHMVSLWKNNKGYSKKIHRLVAQSFIPNVLNYPAVNHIDGDKLNNCVSNLEWCTNKQNTQHALKIGLFNHKGINNKLAKLTEEQVKFIFNSRGTIKQKDLAEQFKVSCSLISMIQNNQRWLYLKKG